MQVIDNTSGRRFKITQSGIGFVRLQEVIPAHFIRKPHLRHEDVDSYWFTKAEFDAHFTLLH